MAEHVQDQSELVMDPGVTGLSWLAAFDHDIPARILFALSSGDGFVVLSGEDKVAAEQLPAILARLREAGFGTATIEAPLPRLAILDDAIRGAMTADVIAAHPLVVVIERADGLAAQTLQRLVALSKLRRAGRPVLRFLLSGTPALWPVLRAAGLGELEGDAAAHVRLMPDLTPCDPPPRPAAGPLREAGAAASGTAAARLTQRERARSSPSAVTSRPSAAAGQQGRSGEYSTGESGIGLTAIIVAAALMLAGIGLAAWVVLKPAPDIRTQAPATLSADDRLAVLLDRENKQIVANHLWSPPGDNLMETRRQIDRLVPQLSTRALRSLAEAAARADAATSRRVAEIPGPERGTADAQPATPAGPAPAPLTRPDAPQPIGNPAHVTVQYSPGDADAEARAMQILAALRGRGVLADGPVPAGRRIERSSVTYGFPQDQATADELAARLLPASTVRRLPQAGGETPRPGEISISVGSDGEAGDTATAPG
jgi:hypothetical protein